MGTEEPRDPLKGLDWKAIGGAAHKEPNGGPITKKRLPKKIRQIPECYFLPRRSLPSAIAHYGTIIAAGVGAGMLVEIWINKKVKEDGELTSNLGCYHKCKLLKSHSWSAIYFATGAFKDAEAVCNPTIITAVYQRSGGSDAGDDDDSQDEL